MICFNTKCRDSFHGCIGTELLARDPTNVPLRPGQVGVAAAGGGGVAPTTTTTTTSPSFAVRVRAKPKSTTTVLPSTSAE